MCTVPLVAVQGRAIEEIVDIAVVVAVHGRDRTQQFVPNERAGHTALDAVLIAAAVPRSVRVAVRFRGWIRRHDIDHAGRGIFPEQRALRSAQNFHPVDVEHFRGCLARPIVNHPIHDGRHRGFDAWRSCDGADAADEYVAIFVGGAGAKVDAGYFRAHILNIVEVLSRGLRPGHDRHGHGNCLQRFSATARSDRNFLEPALRGLCLIRRVRRVRGQRLGRKCATGGEAEKQSA